jgi:hypothetical protein
LLDHSPALGILVARGALDPARELDSEFLLERMEEARDHLWVDPWEPWQERYGRLLDHHEESAESEELREEGAALAAEVDELRRRLRAEVVHVRDLESELDQGTRDLAALTAQRDELAKVITDKALHQDHERIEALEEERRRLRGKIGELQGRISEGTGERAALRSQLAQLSERRGAPRGGESPALRPDPDRDADDSAHAQPAGERRRPILVPSYSAATAKALREIPQRTAREALATIAALAAGDVHAWSSVKTMRTAREILSARVGQAYRLLFRRADEKLECLALIHRRDLEHTLATL